MGEGDVVEIVGWGEGVEVGGRGEDGVGEGIED